jgi:hypothetical protein
MSGQNSGVQDKIKTVYTFPIYNLVLLPALLLGS